MVVTDSVIVDTGGRDGDDGNVSIDGVFGTADWGGDSSGIETGTVEGAGATAGAEAGEGCA